MVKIFVFLLMNICFMLSVILLVGDGKFVLIIVMFLDVFGLRLLVIVIKLINVCVFVLILYFFGVLIWFSIDIVFVFDFKMIMIIWGFFKIFCFIRCCFIFLLVWFDIKCVIFIVFNKGRLINLVFEIFVFVVRFGFLYIDILSIFSGCIGVFCDKVIWLKYDKIKSKFIVLNMSFLFVKC